VEKHFALAAAGRLRTSGTKVPFSRYSAIEPMEDVMGRYALLWLLGVPIPILVLIWAFGGLH
jgi:hypothetical protein